MYICSPALTVHVRYRISGKLLSDTKCFSSVLFSSRLVVRALGVARALHGQMKICRSRCVRTAGRLSPQVQLGRDTRVRARLERLCPRPDARSRRKGCPRSDPIYTCVWPTRDGALSGIDFRPDNPSERRDPRSRRRGCNFAVYVHRLYYYAL